MQRSLLNTSFRDWLLLLLILLTTLILVSPRLMPAFDEINAFDEAKYVDSGKSLTQGEIRDISWGPLVALIYAPLHLVLKSSPDWFILETWIGRFELYALIWLSILYFSICLKNHVHPFVTAGVLLVTLAIFPILENQSDALFLVLSSLNLAVTYRVLQEHRMRDIALGSLFVGLAVLARFEAVLTLAAYVLVLSFLEWKHHKPVKLISAVLLPSFLVLLLYTFAYSISIGRLELRTGGKAWTAFENNQPIPKGDGYILSGGTDAAAKEESERIFGTSAENNGSIVRAIRRNPSAFLQRIWINLKAVPDNFLEFFGKRQAPFLAVIAALGIAAMLQRREYKIIVAGLIWMLPAFVSLAFFSRHFVPQITGLILILGAIGVSSLLEPPVGRIPALVFFGVNLVLVMYALVDSKPAFLASGLVALAVFLVVVLVEKLYPPGATNSAAYFLVFLLGGVILRGTYQFPNIPVYGDSPRELVVHFLQQNMPAGSRVLTSNALVAAAAGMIDVRSLELEPESMDGENLYSALKTAEIEAVILDSIFTFRSQDLDDAILEGIGTFLDPGYIDQAGNIQVLLVR